MITGIEHTAIASPDPMKLARWYVDRLGFVINWQPPNSTTVFVKAPDGHMLEIIEATSPSAGAPAMRDPGLRPLAIMVSDFDTIFRHLQAAGVNFLTTPEKVHGNSL